MPDLEKVIEGLNDLRSHFRAMAGISSSRQGRANHIESARTIEDAIALLKAQEPRVIPFNEIGNYEVLWLEVRDVETEDGLAPWVKTASGRWFSPLLCSEAQPDMILSTPDEYGRICRCWTSRPSDAQREATLWEK